MPLPFVPRNGGQDLTINNSDIRNIYDVFQSHTALAKFKNYINAYSITGKSTTSQMLSYGPKTILNQSGQAVITIPEMVFIGYTHQEFQILDEMYDAIVQELTADPSLASTDYFRWLNLDQTAEQAGATGARQNPAQSLYSLRSQRELKVGTDQGPARGATAPIRFEPGSLDRQLETLIDAKDLKLNTLAGKTEFISRVMHEFMHEAFGHTENAYDPSLSPSANLQAPKFEVSDIDRLDLPYGATKRAMHRLAGRLNLSIAQIDSLAEAQMKEQAKFYERRRELDGRIKIYENIGRQNPPDPAMFDRPELDRLVAAGYIKPLGFPDDIDTPAEQQQWLDNPTNYKMKFWKRIGIPSERRARIDQTITVTGLGVDPNAFEQVMEMALLAAEEYLSEYASETGQAFGSTLGRLLTTNENQFTQITVSTVLGTIGENLGQELEDYLWNRANPELASRQPMARGFENFANDMFNAGVGALSSFLTAELFESLGIDGTLGEIGQQYVASQLTTLVTTLANGGTMAEAISAMSGWTALGNVVGAWVGQKLASELIEFDTVAGQVGAGLGSGIGAAVGLKWGASLGTAWGGPVGAAIGAFIGYIVGGIIGTLFGSAPRTGASLMWNEQTQKFSPAGAWGKGGAPKGGAISIAYSAGQVLNALIELSGTTIVDGGDITFGEFGTRKKEFVYRGYTADGKWVTAFRSLQAELAINFGLAYAVAQLIPRMAGGDVYTKRAIARTLALADLNYENMPALQEGHRIIDNPRYHVEPAQYDVDSLDLATRFDASMLLGNITVAQDYRQYLADRDTIDTLIAAEPTSVFAAAWVATFARVLELGLTKRSITDWIGGWNLFLDETPDGSVGGFALTGANLEISIDESNNERLIVFRGMNNEINGVLGDSIDAAGKDHIVGTSGADTIVVNVDRIANASSLLVNGVAGPAAGHLIKIAARIEGGAGNDTIRGGDLGNDLVGGDGSDTLVGGKLDDWLFGDAGNDRLFAGDVANITFADTDTAAVNAALSARSNGDMLAGGDGDDTLYGSAGSDWIRGGAGVDLIRGGAGGDIIDGGAGNDRGPNGEARLFGGAGTDQYVFGYGDGQDVIFDESDPSSAPGSTGDSIHDRVVNMDFNGATRNWAGGGLYEVDGSIRGGEDAISFAPYVTLADLILRRSGTEAAPGNDLIIQLTNLDPATGLRSLTGDQLTVKDWFESTRRVEWLRFANGEDLRINDLTSFTVGTSGSDLILGTNSADFLYGGAGNDTMFGLNGDDFGFGAEGTDFVSGDGDNDLVAGGTGDDVVIGGAGNDTVFGDANNDRLVGGAGSDILAGGEGNDDIVAGAGGDIIRYQRGDGRDTLMDDLVNNWELVWQSGAYVNGYVLDPAVSRVTKNGVVYFDNGQWTGTYDYDDPSQTLRRHLGAVGGALAANNGVDYLEFGVGIDIQDLMLRRSGNDLQIAITGMSGDAVDFESIADRITVRDWFLTGNSIENFVFAATGTQYVAGMSVLGGGTDGAESLVGTVGADWITAGGGDDTITGDAGIDVLSGNGGNDTIRGDVGSDVLYGGSGDDILEGGAEGDILVGGSGVDIASYANATTLAIRAYLGASFGNTRDADRDQYTEMEGLEGTSGADRLGGDDGANVLRGLGGADTLMGGAGDDIYDFNSSNGTDTIVDAPLQVNEIVSSLGVFNSALYTSNWMYLGLLPTANGNRHCYRLTVTRNDTGEVVYLSRDTIDYTYTSGTTRPIPATSGWVNSAGQWSAALGVQRLSGTSLIVQEILGAGNGGIDEIEFNANVSFSDLIITRLNGGADLRITYGSGHYVTITGQNNPDRAVEYVSLRDGQYAELTRLVLVGETATAENDFVVGDALADTLDGLAGNDVISGGAANDTLRGGDGDDVLEGGAGNDTLDGGNDSISSGAPAGERMGTYGDTIRYARTSGAVVVDLQNSTVTGGGGTDVIVAVNGISTIENVVGSEAFNDTLRGDARINVLSGLAGNDTLEGRGGDDVLIGGVGNDTLRGGDGEDNLTGDEGNDFLYGGNQDDLLAGGDGDDTLEGEAGVDMLSGGAGIDILRGGSEDDVLGGDLGDDTLNGDAGADRIAGGEGNDTISGGDGDDLIEGESGNDIQNGNAGADIFIFGANTGIDTITDTSGANVLRFVDVSFDRLWVTRSGEDLRIGVIGGTSIVNVTGYYAASSPTVASSIQTGDVELLLANAQALITAMTNASMSTPAEMPEAIASTLETYWYAPGAAAPVVVNQEVTTSEDTAISGSVNATDPDNNITAYSVAAAPTRGSVNLNSTTGNWTYTPTANLHGTDSFSILVTDADGNTAIQGVTVSVTSVNDAPTAINATGLVTSIDERDRPISGAPAPTAIVLATLSTADPDAGDTGDFASHAYTVNNSNFEVVGNAQSGYQLRLRASAMPDYETATSAAVTVTSTDRNGSGLSVQRTFTFAVNDRDDYFYGTAGNDTITGTAGRNLIYGHSGADTLTGAGANDLIDGGDGNDTLNGAGGADTVYGQFGDDNVSGGTGNDTLYGGDGNDTLQGNDGADALYGEGGSDTLEGGIGDDVLEGGTHDDTLRGGDGNDTLRGGAGVDLLVGGAGGDRFNGGSGLEIDTVSYAGASSAVTLSLAAGTGTLGDANGDVFEDAIERIIGSDHNDHITGSANSETLEGGAGNDTLVGGAGNDYLIGGAGDDILRAEAGDDMLNGGAGSDLLVGGDHNDTYLMDLSSEADQIDNFDPSGDDIDVLGYQNITHESLWFERSGDDLIVSVVGTTTRTTILNWYGRTTANERANHKIDFFLATGYQNRWIDAEGLVNLMAGHARPTSQAQFDNLRATNAGFNTTWLNAWRLNSAPTIAPIGDLILDEDFPTGVPVALTFTDDTPTSGLIVSVVPSNNSVVSWSLSLPDGNGNRTLTISNQQNASGQVSIRVTAQDLSGATAERTFNVTVRGVADQPTLTGPTVPPPATIHTFESGSIPISLSAGLVDSDSETLEIRISGVPSGISFVNSTGQPVGSLQGDGSYLFTQAQLVGLRIQGPATWSQDLSLTATATSREIGTSSTASRSATLNLPINARPTDISVSGAMSIAENSGSGIQIGQFSRTDPDGDNATYQLLNSADNRFSLSSSGVLTTVGNYNYENLQSHLITVQVTDSGGLTRVEDFTVGVSNVNEAPTAIGYTGPLAFDENAGAGNFVAQFNRTDPDSGDSATFTLDDSSGGRYAISASGQLTTGTTQTNYEASQSHTISVRVTDGGNNAIVRQFTVGVLPVNESPTVNGATFNIRENNPGAGNAAIYYHPVTGANLGQATLSGSDPELSPLRWELVNNSSPFRVNPVTGGLELHGALDYDFGSRNYSFTARAWDGGAVGAGRYGDQTISLTIENTNDSPSIGWLPDPVTGSYNSLIGTITYSDPEGNPATFQLLTTEFYVQVTEWESGSILYQSEFYEPGSGFSVDSAGRVYFPATGFPWQAWGDIWTYRYEKVSGSGRFTARALDSQGAPSGTITVNFFATTSSMAPVVLDLDGDGVELTSMLDSKVRFAMDSGTIRNGWIGADDGFLALDRDGDGSITHGAEISFTGDLDGAISDLEGLAAFDTNGDLWLDSGDERFSDFLVWRDANQDGVSQREELLSLKDAGISSLSLHRTLVDPVEIAGPASARLTRRAPLDRMDGGHWHSGDEPAMSDNALTFGGQAGSGNTISAMTDFIRVDGTRGQAADAALEFVTMQSEVEYDSIDGETPADPEDVSTLDRAASSPPPVPLPTPPEIELEPPAENPVARAPKSGAWAEPGRTPRAADVFRVLRDDRWQRGETEEWQPTAQQPAGALRAPLSLVARRRLQMIDAMSTFAPQGAAELALMPHRQVDSRTLELLTSVSRQGSIA